MTVLDTNRLIAEFMNIKMTRKNSVHHHGQPIFTEESKISLHYHDSWDWLMPVVEKIEQFNHSATLFIIEDERCHVDSQNGFEVDSVGHTKIEAVYNAAIAFINWHNEQKA